MFSRSSTKLPMYPAVVDRRFRIGSNVAIIASGGLGKAALAGLVKTLLAIGPGAINSVAGILLLDFSIVEVGQALRLLRRAGLPRHIPVVTARRQVAHVGGFIHGSPTEVKAARKTWGPELEDTVAEFLAVLAKRHVSIDFILSFVSSGGHAVPSIEATEMLQLKYRDAFALAVGIVPSLAQPHARGFFPEVLECWEHSRLHLFNVSDNGFGDADDHDYATQTLLASLFTQTPNFPQSAANVCTELTPKPRPGFSSSRISGRAVPIDWTQTGFWFFKRRRANIDRAVVTAAMLDSVADVVDHDRRRVLDAELGVSGCGELVTIFYPGNPRHSFDEEDAVRRALAADYREGVPPWPLRYPTVTLKFVAYSVLPAQEFANVVAVRIAALTDGADALRGVVTSIPRLLPGRLLEPAPPDVDEHSGDPSGSPSDPRPSPFDTSEGQ